MQNNIQKNIFLSVICSLGILSLAKADVSIDALQATTSWKRADQILNLIYQDVTALHTGAALQTLIADQEQWLKTRNTSWGDPDVADTQDQAVKFNNLLKATLARELYLEAYTGDRVEPGFAGEYDDSLGGYLSVTPVSGSSSQFNVTLITSRGIDQSSGQFQTVVTVGSPVAAELEVLLTTDNGDGTVCKLDFKRTFHRVDLTELDSLSNSICRHDKGGGFSGIYLKTIFKDPNAN